MTFNEDMEVAWKQKKVIKFDINDDDFIFDDYESSEVANIGRAHESGNEEEKNSHGKTSNDGLQLSDNMNTITLKMEIDTMKKP